MRVLARADYNPIAATAVAILLMGMVTFSCVYAQNVSPLGAVDGIGGVTDVIVGHNNKGPYSLTWTNFDPASSVVVVNGRTLKRGADYNIDPAKGVIAFNSVLVNDAIVRVSYQVQPGKSKKATVGPNIPITLKLRESATGNLKVTGLFQGDSKNPDFGKSIVGIGGDRTWAASKFTSRFLVSQRNDSGGTGDTWERSALDLGGSTSVGKLKFSGSYLHAGADFGGAKEYNTGVGKETMTFATAFAPTKTVQANASYVSTEETAGGNKGNRTVTNAQSVVYTGLTSTKLSLSHATSDLSTTAGHKDLLSTTGIQLSSTAIKRVTLRSAMTQKNSELTGAERLFSAGVSAKPIDKIDLNVDWASLQNKAVGEQISTDVKVIAAPAKQVAIQAGFSDVNSTVAGQTTKTNVAVQATALRTFQVKASAAGTTTNSSRQFQRDFSVSGTPARFAKLMAMFSQKGINSMDDVMKGAELTLTPLRRTRLVAGYKYAESGPRVLTIHDYFAETKPWGFVSLAGSYRQRDLNIAEAPDTASVTLSVAPVRLFTLTGEYQSNPEDKNGAVQAFNSKTVGMSTRIGSLGVETGYSERDEYLTDNMSDERRLSFALPVFGHGTLITGCKLARMLGGDQEARTYRLGYQHTIGSDFSLSLSGNYTQYLQNKVFQPEKAEYTAEAALGAKF